METTLLSKIIFIVMATLTFDLMTPKITRILPLPQGNHVAKFGKDPIYRTKVIVWKPSYCAETYVDANPPTIPNHIIRPVSRWAYKKGALDSQPQVIKFTSCLPMVGGSLQVLRLLPPLKLVAMI